MNAEDISKLVLSIEETKPTKLQIRGGKGDQPRSIGFYNAKKEFIPDIVARFAKKRDFYAIEKNITEKEVHSLVFKWIIFAAEARKYTGTFYLVIPESKAGICMTVVDEKQLDIELIKL